MTLPVLIGPNRCELIYNHEKQPLLELSLRVCFPVRELLSMLSHINASQLEKERIQVLMPFNNVYQVM